MRYIWAWIWDMCEKHNISLGNFAPFVFGKMIGRKGKKIDNIRQN